MKIDLKSIWGHLIPTLVFTVLMFIYFYPVIQGKSLVQSDVIQLKGTNHEAITYREKGDRILWTNSSFGGMPIFTSSPKNLYLILHRALDYVLPMPILTTLLGFVSFYILMQVFGVGIWLSFGAAAAYVLSTFNFISMEAGHVNKVLDMMLMPGVLAGVFMVYQDKIWRGLPVLLLFLGLQIFYGHIQINYYLFIMILGLVIMELVNHIRIKKIGSFIKKSFILLSIAVLTMMANIVHLWSARELAPSTTRGGSELTSGNRSQTGLDYDYAFAWSSGISESFTLLIPYFYGGSSQENLGVNSETHKALLRNGIPRPQASRFVQNLPVYWGEQPGTAGPIYFGAIICFLFLLGFLVINTSLRWWVLSIAVLSIILSWGKNFPLITNFFYYNIPLYNKFRSVTMILSMAQLVFPFFGILALHEYLKTKSKTNLKKLWRAAALSLGLTFIFFIGGSAFFDFRGPNDSAMNLPEWLLSALRSDRASLFRMDALRSFFLILLVTAAIWAYFKDRIKLPLFQGILITLVVVDLWFVNKRYLVPEDFQDEKKLERQSFVKNETDEQILRDPDPYFRVLNLATNTFNEGITSYFHKSVGGYSAIKMRRYQDIIEEHISKNNIRVLNMLNTKYFILVNEEGQTRAQPNPAALGSCWLVKEARVVENADQENEALKTFDPARTALVDQRFKGHLKEFVYDSLAQIRLENYHPMKMSYRFSAGSDQLAVFSDVYYQPGWHSYMDGQPVSHFRVNYILRGMMIPAGEHSITFEFRPPSYFTGEKAGLAASILVILVFGLSVFMVIREKE